MIAVVCDTFVVNANAAVDYRYVFVFINTHGYCIVNNCRYFYGHAVIAGSRHFDSRCCAFFCGSCLYLDAADGQCVNVSRDIAIYCDHDFIVFVFYFWCDCSTVCFDGDFVVVVVGKFKAAVQFQCDFVAFIYHCFHVCANGRFDFQIFNGNYFFHCNVFQFFNGSVDAFGFDGSVYQIIAICKDDVTGIHCYSCLCVFGCFCQLGSQVIGQYPTTFHLTSQYEGQVVCVIHIQIADGDGIAGSVFQRCYGFIAAVCIKDIIIIVCVFCQRVCAVVVFQIDQTCQVIFCCFAADNSFTVVLQEICFIQCQFDFRFRYAAACIVCCGKCQL